MREKLWASIIIALFLVMPMSLTAGEQSESNGIIPTPFAGDSFGGGNGTIWAPYIIEDVDDLQNMSANLSAHYVLGGDIDATNTSTWNGGLGFVPVGNLATKFTGSLNGQNHTVVGLYINRTTDFIGLFGYLEIGSKATYLSLSGIVIIGGQHVGGFTGRNSGNIMNCSSTGEVRGTGSNVGGFAGLNYDGTITSCYSIGNANGSSSVGGFAGHNTGTITNCNSTGSAIGTGSHIGGFAGLIQGGTITNCNSTGSASGNGPVGGFTGWSELGIITDCYSTGNANGMWYVGGFAGHNFGGSITNCYSTGSASGTDTNVGGFAGYNNGGTITNCNSTGNASGTDINVGGFAGYNHDGTIMNCNSTGNASGTGNFVGGFAGCNDDYGTITNSSSIGSASGINRVGGFAGCNVAGAIRNCSATGSANGTWYIGGFAGRNVETITNCYSTGNASGTGNNVGGFVGHNDDGTIMNCYSTGGANGNLNFGGFVGFNGGAGAITDCFWDNETSGLNISDGGSSKTTADMMQQATFTNWDFTTIWCIIEDYTYPHFQPCDFQSFVVIPLSEGWNLISTPLIQSDESIDKVLENITGKWNVVKYYDTTDTGDPWKTYRVGASTNDLADIDNTIGFWINITEPNVNLTVSGSEPVSTNINLYAGWNLVGYPSLTPDTVANALWGTGVDRVEVCNMTEPYLIKEVGPTYIMKPGEGYWVHVSFDTVWVVDW